MTRLTITLSRIAIVLLVLNVGCRVEPNIISLKSTSLPPVFVFSGKEEVSWIWFQGPLPASPGDPPIKSIADPKEIILWKISGPSGRFVPLNDVPDLTYGELPPSWEQEIPKGRSPEKLIDGGIYYISVITSVGHNIHMCIAIRDGQATPVKRYKMCD